LRILIAVPRLAALSVIPYLVNSLATALSVSCRVLNSSTVKICSWYLSGGGRTS
jgi:hypothetical protein